MTVTSKKKRALLRSKGAATASSSSLQGRSSVENKFNLKSLQWIDEIPECPVFHPSIADIDDPLAYLQAIVPMASKYGICKIVSPLRASVPASYVLTKEQVGFEFETYVQPLRFARWNGKDKAKFFTGKSKHDYRSFESMANKAFAQRLGGSKSCLSPSDLEKRFWRDMAQGNGEVEYGVNVDGSAFSSDPNDQLGQSKWNLKTLSKLPKSALRLLKYRIAGITDPMLYIGMLFSMFAWHVEDHYLYSINYHHSGAPKTWYGVPGHAASLLEEVALDHVYSHELFSSDDGKEDRTSAILAEKTTMFPPIILLQHSVPVYKAVQMPGEYVITFPRSYHAGFSHGFNCAEAVNFAIGDWFPWGALAGDKYAAINKMVILPFEELLCKEAVLLSKNSEHQNANLASDQSFVRHSFVQHIGLLSKKLQHLNNIKASFAYSPTSLGTTVCDLCKRDCYLTFAECNSCYHHMCLFHEFKSLVCSCSGKAIVYLRMDIWEVGDAYQKFEQGQQNISSRLEFPCSIKGLAGYGKINIQNIGRGNLRSADKGAALAAMKMKEKNTVQHNTRSAYKRGCHYMRGQSSLKGTKGTRNSKCRLTA